MKKFTTKDIDNRAKELIEEFTQHRKEFVAKNPTMTDHRIIFEGWALQKIASLQLMVELLASTNL